MEVVYWILGIIAAYIVEEILRKGVSFSKDIIQILKLTKEIKNESNKEVDRLRETVDTLMENQKEEIKTFNKVTNVIEALDENLSYLNNKVKEIDNLISK